MSSRRPMHLHICILLSLVSNRVTARQNKRQFQRKENDRWVWVHVLQDQGLQCKSERRRRAITHRLSVNFTIQISCRRPKLQFVKLCRTHHAVTFQKKKKTHHTVTLLFSSGPVFGFTKNPLPLQFRVPPTVSSSLASGKPQFISGFKEFTVKK